MEWFIRWHRRFSKAQKVVEKWYLGCFWNAFLKEYKFIQLIHYNSFQDSFGWSKEATIESIFHIKDYYNGFCYVGKEKVFISCKVLKDQDHKTLLSDLKRVADIRRINLMLKTGEVQQMEIFISERYYKRNNYTDYVRWVILSVRQCYQIFVCLECWKFSIV